MQGSFNIFKFSEDPDFLDKTRYSLRDEHGDNLVPTCDIPAPKTLVKLKFCCLYLLGHMHGSLFIIALLSILMASMQHRTLEGGGI